jgi:NADPH:quinone reductase-like Zn-dependent oxidoreductase
VMMPLLGNGKLKTVIDRVFPLQEAAEAHRYLEAAKQFGKVVLRVDH